MAKVIITIEDTDDGQANVTSLFDPPVDREVPLVTTAQSVAVQVIARLKELAQGG